MTAEQRRGASSQLDQRSGALKDSKTPESDPFFEKRQDFIKRVSTIRLAGQKGLVMDALLEHVDKAEAITVDQLTAAVFPDRIFWDAKGLTAGYLTALRNDLVRINLEIAHEKRGEGRNKRKHYYLNAAEEAKKEKPVKRTFRGKPANPDSAHYFPGTGIRLGGNIGINEDGRLAWIGPKQDPKTLPPNPVTYVKNYELTPNASSSRKGLPKITDFKYKNGEKHPHRIRYEEAEGMISQGICVHCGAHKEGKNWLSETDFLTNEDHRSGAV